MWVAEFRQDVRYALRLLARSPLFAATAVLSLAIGIGADAAFFTLAKALLLQAPAGVSEPDRLVDIDGSDDQRFGVNQVSFLNYLDLRERATSLADAYGYEPFAEAMSLVGPEGAERVFGHRVTANYFAVLGVGPGVGRLFDPGRAGDETDHTIVLSDAFWTRRFNRDPSMVGRSVSLNGTAFVVAGVTPASFRGTSLVATDLWVAYETAVGPGSYLAERGLGWALVRGRLKPQASITQAAAEVDAIGRALERQYPNENRGRGLRLKAASFLPGNLALPLAAVATLVLAFVS